MSAERQPEERETTPEFIRWFIRRAILFLLIIMLAWAISAVIRRLF
jgi:hypothetical protein